MMLNNLLDHHSDGNRGDDHTCDTPKHAKRNVFSGLFLDASRLETDINIMLWMNFNAAARAIQLMRTHWQKCFCASSRNAISLFE